MSSIPAKELSDWYELFRKLIQDIRSFFPRERKSRLELYDELFRSIRVIHVDYIIIFRSFIEWSRDSTKKEFKAAKSRFLSARIRHTDQRTLSKFDASNFLAITNDLSEQRFLASILWYFHYASDPGHFSDALPILDKELWSALTNKDGGDAAWDSASSYFWFEIRDTEDATEAVRLAEELLLAINARFSLILQSYTQLEQYWLYGKRPMETIVSKEILKIDFDKAPGLDMGNK